MTWTLVQRPDLSRRAERKALKARYNPYYFLFCYGRHLGYRKHSQHVSFWVARARTSTGSYTRHRLGRCDDYQTADGKKFLSFEQAGRAAWDWFQTTDGNSKFSDPMPIGIRPDLAYEPVGSVYTIGHALHEYISWKRISTAPSYTQTLISLSNHHILPRLATLPVSEFNGERFRWLVQEILETPANFAERRGGVRYRLEDMESDVLRKRKETVNTVIGILRIALQMAWENGKTDSERCWRVLRRLPNVSGPRLLHLSRNECRSLLVKCPPELGLLVLGALYTGCRFMELARIEASHVGHDGYGVYVTPVKTYRPRFVFLPDEGMAFFLRLAKNKQPRDLIFTRADGSPWYRRHLARFKRSVIEAGLPREFTFHGLRHTYASQLVQAGAPLVAVADQLGHINVNAVCRTYGHLAPQIREAEVRQRFTSVSKENAKLAMSQRKRLTQWRKSLHGTGSEAYAIISDLRSRSRTK